MADQRLASIGVLDEEGWCIRVVSKGRCKASNRDSFAAFLKAVYRTKPSTPDQVQMCF